MRARISGSAQRRRVDAVRQKCAMLAAVSRLMSGLVIGKTSVPWIDPITWRQ
jgi:hypothetical protein